MAPVRFFARPTARAALLGAAATLTLSACSDQPEGTITELATGTSPTPSSTSAASPTRSTEAGSSPASAAAPSPAKATVKATAKQFGARRISAEAARAFGEARLRWVVLTGIDFPARMRNGTPDQRQLSMRSRRAAYVSVVDPGATPATDWSPIEPRVVRTSSISLWTLSTSSFSSSPTASRTW